MEMNPLIKSKNITFKQNIHCKNYKNKQSIILNIAPYIKNLEWIGLKLLKKKIKAIQVFYVMKKCHVKKQETLQFLVYPVDSSLLSYIQPLEVIKFLRSISVNFQLSQSWLEDKFMQIDKYCQFLIFDLLKVFEKTTFF